MFLLITILITNSINIGIFAKLTVNSASNYVDFKYKYEKNTQYAFIIHSKGHRIYQLSGSIGIPAVTINF